MYMDKDKTKVDYEKAPLEMNMKIYQKGKEWVVENVMIGGFCGKGKTREKAIIDYWKVKKLHMKEKLYKCVKQFEVTITEEYNKDTLAVFNVDIGSIWELKPDKLILDNENSIHLENDENKLWIEITKEELKSYFKKIS